MIGNLLNMLIFCLVVSYFASIFKYLIEPWFSRKDRGGVELDVLLYPIREWIHLTKSSNLNFSRDITSIIFIVCYQSTLLILSQFDRISVVETSMNIFFLYILMAMVSVFKAKWLGNSVANDRVLIASIKLSCIVCCIGILQKFYFGNEESLLAQIFINIYGFVLLITGLSLTKAVSPDLSGDANIYQRIESRLASITWICIFVASVSPDDINRFQFASAFMFKVIFVVGVFAVADLLVAEKSKRLQEEWIYKFAIPLGLVSIFGIWVGANYV